jgi:hypothetical protein
MIKLEQLQTGIFAVYESTDLSGWTMFNEWFDARQEYRRRARLQPYKPRAPVDQDAANIKRLREWRIKARGRNVAD